MKLMDLQNPNSFPVKATLLVVSTLTVMAGATIAPSLPAMRENFVGVPNIDFWVKLVLTVPALFIALGGPLVGTIIDRFGRKPLLGLAVLLYGVAGSSGFFLNSIGLILVGRVLLGLSVAGIMVTSTTLIADYYNGAARAQFLGFQAAFMSLGGVIFLTVGGFLADLNWRMPFLIYLLAWLVLPFILLVLPESDRANNSSSTSQMGAPAEPNRFSWKLIGLTYGIALFSQIVFYLIPVQLPFYLKQLANASASQSGLAIAVTTLASSITSLSYQRLKARFSFINIYALGFFLIGIGYEGISFAKSYEMALIGLAIGGLGLGMLMPNMNVYLTSMVSSTARGRVLGGLTTAFFLGQFTSPILSQSLIQWVGLSATYGIAGGSMLVLTLAAVGVARLWR